ncbi:DUF6452 family protein [Cochleicola gelatinilyticus]|uniref:Lipoprotein n=1 Tax=Cochleicola gelatinilyticus TaxID=1763537 RepID=A0A167H680_9FLAO|nr:DUF6452 family protein [Cochleicola gelatinilyticus]OAB78257.1 hypothetical protein ULVI_12335 [Cochleicola gelatinilyticus]
MNFIKKGILVSLITLFFYGCSRDDICSGETLTTPKLIIVFKNVLNPLEASSVVGLSIEADFTTTGGVVLETTTSDSIAIPLRTNALETQFRFIQNTGATNENTDIVTFNYITNELYVNRACGFKTNYDNLEGVVTDDETNWIQNLTIEKQLVEDEQETHITILH